MANLRNSIQKFFEIKEQKEIVTQAKQRFEYKPFYMAYRQLFQTAKYGRGLFHLFSISTGLTFLALLIDAALNLFPLSLLLAGLLLAFWEVGKTVILTNLFIAYYGSNGKKIPYALSAIGAIFLAGSVFCSIEGAKSFYQANDTQTIRLQALHTIQADSLNGIYTVQTKAIDARIKDIEANKPKRWGGLLSASENKQILNYQNQIDRLEQEQGKAMAGLKEVQEKQLLESNSKVSFNVWAFATLTGINEALILLIAWFLVFYDYQTAIESEALASPPMEFSLQSVQKLIETIAIASSGEQVLLASGNGKGQNSIGFHVQGSASAASANRQDSGKNAVNGSASAATDLMTDISNGIRDFRYLMHKHKVNVLTVKEAIDTFNNS